MDQPGTDQEALLLELKRNCMRTAWIFRIRRARLCGKCGGVRDEQVLEQYLAGEAAGTEQIKRLIRERKSVPHAISDLRSRCRG